jgi:hypothetical protein
MAPFKAKQNIWQIAEETGTVKIVQGYGVDLIWEVVKAEAENDIFTPVSEICKQTLKKLAEL